MSDTTARRESGRAAGLLGAVMITLLVIWWAAGTIVVAGICILTLPILASFYPRTSDGARALPGFICAATVVIFFGSGLARWKIRGELIDFYQVGRVPGPVVLLVITAVVACTIPFVLFEKLLVQNLHRRQSTTIVDVMSPLCSILFALSCSGAVLLVIQLGGWESAVNLLQTHNKEVIGIIGSSVGLSLWSVFALPAGIVAGVLATLQRAPRQKLLRAAQLVVILSIAAVLFGSRLTITLIIIGISAVVFTEQKKYLRARHAVVGVLVMMVLTSYVYAGRSVGSAGRENFAVQSLTTLSYGLFDVGTGAWLARDDLSESYVSSDRILEILKSYTPRLGAGRVQLEDERLDVVTVRAIGRNSSAYTTGLPPSLPIWLIVGYGIPVGVLLSAGLGCVAALVTRSLLVTRRVWAPMGFGLWSAFLFNVFKDGDIVLNLGAEVRRIVYLTILYTGVKWALLATTGLRRRDRNHHEVAVYSS